MGVWPFKKKYLPKNQLSFEDSWTMLRAISEGKPMLVRRRSVSGLLGHPEYPYQVGIAIPCNNPDSNGFPGKDELPQLNKIEDKLMPTLQQDKESVLVMVITTGNMREFVFYTSSPDGVKAKFAQLQKSVTTHELQIIIQMDKNWSIFRRFGK
jgi:hypothetical protein